jgi:hypothetical protein
MASSKVPDIFSSKRRAASYARARNSGIKSQGARWLVDEMLQDIAERLEFMRHEPKRVLAIGLGSEDLAGTFSGRDCQFEAVEEIDEELPISGGPFDLIVSLDRLGTVNDLPGAMIHMRTALATGGLAIASLAGAGSLPSLRRIMMAADGERPAARIHPLIDNRAGSALLDRAGFARQVVDTVPLKVSYTSLDRLVADLREQALTNVLADPPPPISKSGLTRARQEFDRLRNDEGRVIETFEILTLTGWA